MSGFQQQNPAKHHKTWHKSWKNINKIMKRLHQNSASLWVFPRLTLGASKFGASPKLIHFFGGIPSWLIRLKLQLRIKWVPAESIEPRKEITSGFVIFWNPVDWTSGWEKEISRDTRASSMDRSDVPLRPQQQWSLVERFWVGLFHLAGCFTCTTAEITGKFKNELVSGVTTTGKTKECVNK